MPDTTKLDYLNRVAQDTIYRERIDLFRNIFTTISSKKEILKQAQKYPFIQKVLRSESSFHDLSDADKTAALDAVLSSDVYDRVNLKENEGDKDFDYIDQLVKELLKWFKEEFFTWVNKPDCTNCNNSDQERIIRVSTRPPFRKEHILGNASVIEMYQCLQCKKTVEFPRYNNVETLIKTRRGRCGEWNNCFLSILRALDIEARYILNMEDHVWCEYYSAKQGRWIHLDSCENAYDQPLLYSDGWGKKMSYVFAITNEYIIDVSDKYINVEKPEMRLPLDKQQHTHLIAVLAITNCSRMLRLSREDFVKTTSHLVSDFKSNQKTSQTSATEENTKQTEAELLPRQSGDTKWTKERGEGGF